MAELLVRMCVVPCRRVAEHGPASIWPLCTESCEGSFKNLYRFCRSYRGLVPNVLSVLGLLPLQLCVAGALSCGTKVWYTVLCGAHSLLSSPILAS